jgi:hypothetical protein
MEDKSLLFRRQIWLHRATGVLFVRAITTSRVDKYVQQMFVVVTAQLYLLQKFNFLLRERDLNPQPLGYEPSELPLLLPRDNRNINK